MPLSGGDTAVYNASGLAYYRHTDWLGSSRLASAHSRTVYYDGAYAPYGENYAEMGTQDREFAGINQDTVATGPYPLYDGLYREYHPVWGRWVNPDPAGLAAVNLANPQTWNRYAYVTNNPVALTDPRGLLARKITDSCGPGEHYPRGDLGLEYTMDDGSCSIDGMSMDCESTYRLLNSGIGVECPNHQCSGTFTNQFGVTEIYQYWAFAGAASAADGYYPGLGPLNPDALAIEAVFSI